MVCVRVQSKWDELIVICKEEIMCAVCNQERYDMNMDDDDIYMVNGECVPSFSCDGTRSSLFSGWQQESCCNTTYWIDTV